MRVYSYEEFLQSIEISYDNWDDFGYKNTAKLSIDDEGILFNIYPNKNEIYNQIKLGDVKTKILFVLGSRKYYELINSKLRTQEDRNRWYELTNDLAYNIDLLDYFLNKNGEEKPEVKEEIKKIIVNSFMRFIGYSEIKNQLHRMTKGGKYLEAYNVSVLNKDSHKLILDINVDPDVDIPENTFGLIGKNGSGKTYILNNLAKSFLNQPSIFSFKDKTEDPFNKVLHVSYSPFDNLEISNTEKVPFEKIGLTLDINNKYDKTISECFNIELGNCIKDIISPGNIASKDMWLSILENFSYENWIADFLKRIEGIHLANEEHGLNTAICSLSSGQKIILLTITNLILKVREKTLVLIDEPELFLHPSLAKSYIRGIIEIITKTNGICIIATHNPLILQELQTRCVNVTIKENDRYDIKNLMEYKVNSYGESVNVLNNVIFGIDIQNTGYYQYLASFKNKNKLIEKSEELFNKMGSEGRVLLSYLISE